MVMQEVGLPNAVISSAMRSGSAPSQPKPTTTIAPTLGLFATLINVFSVRRASPATWQQPKSLFTHVAPFTCRAISWATLFAQTLVGKIST
ncbi:Uncharacterised protein [Salmonella enterica subsp. enterica serovar Bovismorbificans]|uniref:Uncharacterized protein n=1 Tax=Salmonella enterica subsp. enterica serovar Bovismorbificans TaxID=58097 RepID=A0A655BKU2_SALET|nr:Uncharacterised protein [Salmonella enterica subsp. enterica serovar Bovismorbificans]